MLFHSREQAARLLAGRLHHLRSTHPLVLAIPRGGISMAKILADSLGGEMDVILVRKMAFPNNPEMALGAVDEEGTAHLNEYLSDYGITDEYIQRERAKQLAVIHARRDLYAPARPTISKEGRMVIIVDDGTATGFSMATAVNAVRRSNPYRIIAAIAVAPPDALTRIRGAADETVCLHMAENFVAVSEYFEDFPEISDKQVVHILSGASELVF